MLYLIDTDWVINCLHGIRPVMDRVDQLQPDGIGISPVSLAELYDGILGDADPAHSEQELFNFLARGIDTVAVDLETSRIFAQERRRLRAAGNLIPDFDLLIGATALRHNLTLLSNNRRHFQRINGLNLLSV